MFKDSDFPDSSNIRWLAKHSAILKQLKSKAKIDLALKFYHNIRKTQYPKIG